MLEQTLALGFISFVCADTLLGEYNPDGQIAPLFVHGGYGYAPAVPRYPYAEHLLHQHGGYGLSPYGYGYAPVTRYPYAANPWELRIEYADGMEMYVDMRPRIRYNAAQMLHMLITNTITRQCGATSWVRLASGYGNWCGFGGDGNVVDRIDACCRSHDFCYTAAQTSALRNTCSFKNIFAHPVFWTYEWTTQQNIFTCFDDDDRRCDIGGADFCECRACICDSQFVECLARQPCPRFS